MATALSKVIVRASDAPMAALVASALPLASVEVSASSEAFTVRSPRMVSSAPEGRSARTAFCATLIPMTGVTADPPAASAPPSTLVVMAWVPSASMVRFCAPVSAAFPPSDASVSMSETLTPMETPTPMVLPDLVELDPVPLVPLVPPEDEDPVDCAFFASVAAPASTEDSVFETDFTTTSPAPVMATTASFDTSAEVDTLGRFNAKDPATPVEPPLAPEVALAPNVWVWSSSRSNISA